MKKLLLSLGIITLLILLEVSWSGFFSLQERSYFFLFSFVAVSVLQRGFLPTLFLNGMTLVIFEGVTQSGIGAVSLYGILFAYGMSFILKRFHLEYGGERIFLALIAGMGMALYPLFASLYVRGFPAFSLTTFFEWSLFQNMLIGSILFLMTLRIASVFRQEHLLLPTSFSK